MPRSNMEVARLCIAAMLSLLQCKATQQGEGLELLVEPDRLQFFQYEAVRLRCQAPEGPAEIRFLHRQVGSMLPEEHPSCSRRGGHATAFCTISSLYPRDTGLYWCQSANGDSSDTVYLEVTDGRVILESPAVPPALGASVNLRCSGRSENLTAWARVGARPLTAFYRDGVTLQESHWPNMSRGSWSAADTGRYKCSIAGEGESPSSHLGLAGGGRHEEERRSPGPLLLTVSLLAVLLLGALLLLAFRRRSQAGRQLQPESVYHQTPDSAQLQPAEGSSLYSLVQEVGWRPPQRP